MTRTEPPQPVMPLDWEPPVPAFSSVSDAEMITVVYLAAQSVDQAEAMAGLERIRAFLSLDEGPFHVDLALHESSFGYVDAVAIAYWHGVDSFELWARGSGFADWWSEDVRLADKCGFWQERLVVPAERIEALHSSPLPDGHSHGGAIVGPIRAHAYWGGMRDRLKASATDWLDSSVGSTLSARQSVGSGRRVLINAPSNLCVIRSGQDLSDADAGERALYEEVVRGNLVTGMRYLAEQGEPDGCCTARYMTEIDPDGIALERTFGHCLFLSLAHLENWAKSHPTHLAIFGSFFRLLKERNNQIALRLWHEVAVLPADRQHFEYLNCHAATGLSGYFI
jgi:aldoxime dehydratase